MTPCFVINLDRSPERWSATRQALEAAGLNPVRLAATDAQNMTKEELERPYDARRNKWRYFAGLKPAEIACFLSHRQAWMRVVEAGRSAIVCEDDIAIERDLARMLGALDTHFEPDVAVAVKLYTKRNVSTRRILIIPGADFALKRPNVIPLGGVAYWVTPTSAARLLHKSETFFEPLDVFLQKVWRHKIIHWVMDPAPVTEVSHRLGGSTLGEQRRSGLVKRIKREMLRPAFRGWLIVRSAIFHLTGK